MYVSMSWNCYCQHLKSRILIPSLLYFSPTATLVFCLFPEEHTLHYTNPYTYNNPNADWQPSAARHQTATQSAPERAAVAMLFPVSHYTGDTKSDTRSSLSGRSRDQP